MESTGGQGWPADRPSLRPALHEGAESHTIEGVPLRVYSPAKTVADCFKFRHKIGLGVAL